MFSSREGERRFDRRFCVAPMLDWTDRHQRMFMRCITRYALLYTEMVTPANIERDPDRYLAHHRAEHPLALQLGGSDPQALARVARIALGYRFDEVNLNLGCPSPRVGAGAFGAVLMKRPKHAAELVAALRDAVSVPVTVKMRIGVDDVDSEAFFLDLVGRLYEAGTKAVIVHARKAWLQGLSPKENREVPPLRYERVLAVKRAFPGLPVVLNGGLEDLDQACAWLDRVDGVMVGRAAYQHPHRWFLVDPRIYGRPAPAADRFEALAAYRPYLADELACGTPLHFMARHLLPLFDGLPGARHWRRHLSRNMHAPGAGLAVIDNALAALERVHTPEGSYGCR